MIILIGAIIAAVGLFGWTVSLFYGLWHKFNIDPPILAYASIGILYVGVMLLAIGMVYDQIHY